MKMKISFVAWIFLLWVPLCGAQSSSDVVLQFTTSPKEWPAVYADWRAAGAANDKLVSMRVIGVMAHNIAVSQNHPAGKMEVLDYIRAFFESNSALMPENGTVNLETFLTLARAGKLRHPPVPVTAANEVTVTPEAVPSVMETVARDAAVVASNKADAAWQMANKASMEVEKLASQSKVTDPAVLRRITSLEAKTTADLTVMQQKIDGQEKTNSENARDLREEMRKYVGLQGEAVRRHDSRLSVLENGVADLTKAPPPDNFARLLTGVAITLALVALIFGFFTSNRAKEAQRIADLAHTGVTELKSVQVGHAEQLKMLSRKTEHLRDIKIDPYLVDKLRGLSGKAQHTTRVWVDDEEYRVIFRLSEEDGEQHMFRVEGVFGQHKAFLATNAISILKRAGRDDRIRGVTLSPAKDVAKDVSAEGDNIVPIQQQG